MSFQHNRTLAVKYLKEIFGQWRYDLIEEVVHENYHMNESSVDLIKRHQVVKKGREAFHDRVESIRIGMPNMVFNILKIIAEEDGVITWWSWEGTQDGTLFGFPPKGKEMKIFGTNFFEIKDEKIYSSLTNFDTFSFLIQLGHALVQVDQEDLVLQYLKNLEEMGPLEF
ncbi:MAG: ester cyclase [Candidatus Kariarchaeaceae archaeon]|jgi:steroid delta-isomerase-like uncharacterized protein